MSQIQEFKTKLGPEKVGAFYLWLALYRDAVLGRLPGSAVKRVSNIMAACLSARETPDVAFVRINKAGQSAYGASVVGVPQSDWPMLDRFAARLDSTTKEGGEG